MSTVRSRKNGSRPKDTVTALVPIRDANGGISSVVPIDYTAKATDGTDALRITSVYGKTSSEAVQSWIDQGYLLYADRKNISRSFPHRLQLPGRTKTAKRFLDENDFSEEQLGSIPNYGASCQGGKFAAGRSSGELVALGMAYNRAGRPVFVRSVIDSRNGADKISKMEVVYAVDARKGNSASHPTPSRFTSDGKQSRAHVDDGIAPSSVSKGETAISISNLLEISKGVFGDIFSRSSL